MSHEVSNEGEDFSLRKVPVSERKSFISILVVLVGFTFFTATMWAGGSLGEAFSLSDLIGVSTLGNLILGSYAAILGYIAYKSGLHTILMSRYSFGSLGSKGIILLLGFTQIGWYSWGTATIAIVMVRLLGLSEALTIPLMSFFGFAFCWTAFIGYKGLEVLSRWAIPAMLILIACSFIIATRDGGGIGNIFRAQPTTGTMDISTALTIIFGTFASGGTMASNWIRFSKNARTAIITSLVAFFIGNGLMIFIGAYGAIVYQESDIVNVLALQGLALLGVLMLLLNIWTTQDNAIYVFSVVSCSLVMSSNRRLMTIIGAAIGTLLAIFNMYKFLVPYLIMLGTFIPPIGGVIMADFFFKRKGVYSDIDKTKLPSFNFSGIFGYLCGALAGYMSPFVPPIAGIIVSILAYVSVELILRLIGSTVLPAKSTS